MSDTIASTSDDRTTNNVMRHQYRVLSGTEKAQMLALKEKGHEFWRLLHAIGQTPHGERFASRELAHAATKIEEAVMWAVKHVTR